MGTRKRVGVSNEPKLIPEESTIPIKKRKATMNAVPTFTVEPGSRTGSLKFKIVRTVVNNINASSTKTSSSTSRPFKENGSFGGK